MSGGVLGRWSRRKLAAALTETVRGVGYRIAREPA